MNALDNLREKQKQHEPLTALERAVLLYVVPKGQQLAAAQLAAKDETLQALTDLVEQAKAEGRGTVTVEELEAIVASVRVPIYSYPKNVLELHLGSM